VSAVKVDVKKTLMQLERILGFQCQKQSRSWAQIPLWSFLFGVKLKKQKPSLVSVCDSSIAETSSWTPYVD
jgi:hypothetical protein